MSALRRAPASLRVFEVCALAVSIPTYHVNPPRQIPSPRESPVGTFFCSPSRRHGSISNYSTSTSPLAYFNPPRLRLPILMCSRLVRLRFLITCLSHNPIDSPHTFELVHHLLVGLVSVMMPVLSHPTIGPGIRLMECAHTAAFYRRV